MAVTLTTMPGYERGRSALPPTLPPSLTDWLTDSLTHSTANFIWFWGVCGAKNFQHLENQIALWVAPKRFEDVQVDGAREAQRVHPLDVRAEGLRGVPESDRAAINGDEFAEWVSALCEGYWSFNHLIVLFLDYLLTACIVCCDYRSFRASSTALIFFYKHGHLLIVYHVNRPIYASSATIVVYCTHLTHVFILP